MNDMPLISVIVPVYKVEKYLRKCLDSIINQTYKKLEIIIVHDYSSDNCGTICDEYANRDSRIQVIHREVAGGLSSARNVGIDAAAGEWLMFVDSDDWIYCNNNLEEIAKHLNRNKPDVLIYGMCKYFESTNTYLTGNLPQKIAQLTGDNLLIQLVKCNIFKAPVWDKIIKNSVVKQYEMKFNECMSTSEDTPWSGKIISNCKTCLYLPIIVYVYNQRNGTISSSISNERIMNALQNLNNAWIEKDSIDDRIKRQIFLNYYSGTYIYILGLCGKNYKQYKDDLRLNRRYLEYIATKKNKIIAFLVSTLGLRLTTAICGFYIRNKLQKKNR